MINENLQILHISNPLSSSSLASFFLSLKLLSFLALILIIYCSVSNLVSEHGF